MSILETFRTTSQPQRLALWIGAGVILFAVLVAIYLLFIRQPYEVLFNNLRSMDAATIVAELDKKKIPYRLEDRGETILVRADQVDATRLSVMSSDLPLKGMVGFEIFNKSDMGLTEFAQRINYQRALQGELARTMMTLDGVDTARVHLSIPEPTVFREDRRPAKASVTLQTRPGKSLSPGAVRGIKRLVAAAIPDLELANVVVLDQRGLEVGAVTQAAVGHTAVEISYAERISALINRDFPLRLAKVEVWAEPIDEPSSGQRPFNLKVSVSLSPDASAEDRERIQSLVIAATDLDITSGDMVVVLGEALAPEPALDLVVAPVDSPSTPTGPSAGLQLWVSSIIGLLLLVSAAMFLLRHRLGSPRGLSERERETFKAELQALLEKRRSDAAFAP